LCRFAVAVTLKGLPAAAEAGAEAETLFTFISEAAVMLVVELPAVLLLPLVGSLTWSWSTVTDAATENWCADGLVHVTDQLAGLPGTAAVTEVESEVFWTVCGLVDEVVQSPGRARVSVVSAFTGPYGPLL
jgi:hypothetical protein